MSELRTLLSDTTEKVLKDLPADFDTGWDRIHKSGLALTMVDDESDGYGGSWQDALVVVKATGFHATPFPVSESLLVSMLFFETAEPQSLCGDFEGCVSADTGENMFTGVLRHVPYGRRVTGVVANAGRHGEIVYISCDEAIIEEGQNLAGEARDTLRLSNARVIYPVWSFSKVEDLPPRFTGRSRMAPDGKPLDLFLCGALIRTAQIAGAMEAALALCVEYTRQRQQFGKPLASFQAIQQQLAVLAEETAAAGMAAASAFRAADRGEASFEIAAAKLRANRAVTLGAGIAHQVHGAMGFTAEYRLQHLTRRLWAWQSEFGNERYWADRIGAGVAARGAENFWADLVALSDQ